MRLLCVTILSTIAANAQPTPIADHFINPLEGGWPAICAWGVQPPDPTVNCISQGFGDSSDNKLFPFSAHPSGWFSTFRGYHLAYDVHVPYLMPTDPLKAIYAPANGIVIFQGFVMGYTIVIEHLLPSNDPDGPVVYSMFFHMLPPSNLSNGDPRGIPLTTGQIVNISDVIGYVSPRPSDYGCGSAQTFAQCGTGPHQHYGVRKAVSLPSTISSNPMVHDSRTGFPYFVGYSSVKPKTDGPDDPIQKAVVSEWFNPYDFLARHSKGLVLTTGAVSVQATLNGSPWSGLVNYRLTCAGQPVNGSTVPQTFNNEPIGGCSIANISGEPPNSTLSSVSPSASQTLVSGGTITYVLNFASNPPIAGFTMSSSGNSVTDGQSLAVLALSAGTATIYFDATTRSRAVNNATVTGWLWSINGITSADTSTFTHSFTPGTYTVSLVVTDNHNQQSQPVIGTIRSAAVTPVTPSVLYSFDGIGGKEPTSALVVANDGLFYGTAPSGGAADAGTIFQIGLDGAFKLVYSFASSPPVGSLFQSPDGYLYGLTWIGGGTFGTVFKVDLSGNFFTIHSFGPPDGVSPSMPTGALIQAKDGYFYGVTVGGGNYNCGYSIGCGTIFKMDSLGNLTVLHRFSGPDGFSPWAGLIQGSDGNFYGTTYLGGTNNQGTVFKMDLSGNVTTIHSFKGCGLGIQDGANPHSKLLQGNDGYIYGTTLQGGCVGNSGGRGAVFKMDLAGNFTLLHGFSGTDGWVPWAELIQGSDGIFYGTTESGGAIGNGTIFGIDSSGNFALLYSFGDLGNPQGASPDSALIQGSDGSFYGTTYFGGALGIGVVYRFSLFP